MGIPYDSLDIESLLESAFDAFCEAHQITGREAKQKVLKEIAATARDMKGRQ